MAWWNPLDLLNNNPGPGVQPGLGFVPPPPTTWEIDPDWSKPDQPYTPDTGGPGPVYDASQSYAQQQNQFRSSDAWAY